MKLKRNKTNAPDSWQGFYICEKELNYWCLIKIHENVEAPGVEMKALPRVPRLWERAAKCPYPHLGGLFHSAVAGWGGGLMGSNQNCRIILGTCWKGSLEFFILICSSKQGQQQGCTSMGSSLPNKRVEERPETAEPASICPAAELKLERALDCPISDWCSLEVTA